MGEEAAPWRIRQDHVLYSQVRNGQAKAIERLDVCETIPIKPLNPVAEAPGMRRSPPKLGWTGGAVNHG